MDDQHRAKDDPMNAVLAQLGGVVFSEQTLDQILDQVATLAEQSVPGAAAVSVTVRRGGEFSTPHATANVARDLDGVQYATAHGPCLQAIASQRPVNVVLESMRADWPEFVAASDERGMRSVLSTPLASSAATFGALNIYGENPEQFGERGVEVAAVLAAQASVVLTNAIAFAGTELLNTQLRQALESRDVIGQAKGVLMAQQGCSSERAFDMLRRASQRENRKLREVAADVVGAVEERRP